ncbi:hypothetical protein EII34_12125 [Arachnia propionica]|uniref:Uncharacterized protein n=1 Tax=Arachnia propionica TaxID=1750 RepID=A0A3P1T382_9ACTN|nr:NfeD family protein [Arachnia propionica]RRD03921.1 hypothetical protein EII34_12125 [Arachnia propionica]
MSIFLILGIAGSLFLVASIILGDFFEAAFHFDGFDSEIFSLAALAAFVGAFGFGGVAASAFAETLWLMVPVGIVCGIVAAWGAIALTRWLKRGETGAAVSNNSLIGAEARVVTDIPAVGFGEVHIHGSHDKRAASSEVSIPAGTQVWVSAIISPTAVEVRPVTAELPPR